MPLKLLDVPIKWRLAVVMADRELDYKQVAEITGFAPETVNKHKNMKRMPKRLLDSTLESYCRALTCQPGDLLVMIDEAT